MPQAPPSDADSPTLTGAPSAPQDAGGPVRVGLVLPQSGVYAPLGADMQRGWDLWLAQHRGTLGGREVVAVVADEGEGPDATAGRELVEETGYRAGVIRRVAEWWVSPGVMTERMYLYLCEDLEPGPPEHQPLVEA